MSKLVYIVIAKPKGKPGAFVAGASMNSNMAEDLKASLQSRADGKKTGCRYYVEEHCLEEKR